MKIYHGTCLNGTRDHWSIYSVSRNLPRRQPGGMRSRQDCYPPTDLFTLAYSVIADVAGEEYAEVYHIDFALTVLTKMPFGRPWFITSREVKDFIQAEIVAWAEQKGAHHGDARLPGGTARPRQNSGQGAVRARSTGEPG